MYLLVVIRLRSVSFLIIAVSTVDTGCKVTICCHLNPVRNLKHMLNFAWYWDSVRQT